MSDAGLSLYVHLPWCVRKCPYCDFNSHQLKSGVPDPSYIDALLIDRSRRRAMGERGRTAMLSRYGIDRLVDDVESLYRELLA